MDDAVRKSFEAACRHRGMTNDEMMAVEHVALTVIFSTMEHLTNTLTGFGADLPVAHREICLGLVLDGMADGVLALTKAGVSGGTQ